MKTGSTIVHTLGRTVFTSFVAAAFVASLLAVVSVSPAAAQTVTESFLGDAGTQAGMLVQLDEKDKSRVKPANQAKQQAVHGVVVLPNDAPLSLSEATNERQVYVATTGTYKVLVSDQNGTIRKDDFIVVSAIDGVGMLADSQSGFVAGKAVSGFDGVNDVKSQTKVTDSNGKERAVRFGYIMANINVTRNPIIKDKAPNLPGYLKTAADGIADKPVNPVRVYLSLVVAVFTAIIVAVVMTTGIRSSVISLGRNPLARKSIVRNLLQVVLIGLMILIVGLFGVYLLLRL